MCLGVPMKVLSVNRKVNTAVVEMNGLKRSVNISLAPEVRAGDYLMIHAGFAIGKIDPAQAQESLDVWEDFKEHVDL